jgi:hypothetical protein
VHQHRRTRSLATVLLVAALSLGAAACSDEQQTPEEQRRDRVEKRLKLSFSDEQVACMLDRFDDEVLAALDRDTGLPEGQAMIDYTTIARECVVGESTASTAPVPVAPTDGTGSTDSTGPTTGSTDGADDAPPADGTTEPPPDSAG